MTIKCKYRLLEFFRLLIVYVVICVTSSCMICLDVYLCLYDNLQTLEEIKLSSVQAHLHSNHNLAVTFTLTPLFQIVEK